MTIITDSSFIYALYNTKDSRHHQAMDFATHYTGGTVVPDIILPEVSYLFIRDLGYVGVQTFFENFKRLDAQLEPLHWADLERVHEISVAYATAEFDVVDCCIMALAERLTITQIATFDRRDFSIVRPGTAIIWNCCRNIGGLSRSRTVGGLIIYTLNEFERDI